MYALTRARPVDIGRESDLAATPTRQNGSPMAHALAAFIREQMDERNLRNRDVVRDSGLSRALVSKYVTDHRDTLTRLPERSTLEGFAKAFKVPVDFLFGKAVESLGLGYTSGDFVNRVATASDRELLDEIEERLRKRGEERARSSAPIAVLPGGRSDDESEPAVERAAYEDEHDIEEEQGHDEHA